MKHLFFLLAFCVSMSFTICTNALNAENTSLTGNTSERNFLSTAFDEPVYNKKETDNLISQQQRETVTGKVIDFDGEPIIGASVIEHGVPSNGTITNIDGEFSISVNKNSVLDISYIGYVTRQVNAVSGRELVVKLVEDLKALDEVVVVGYGQQRTATLTGSVSQIKSEKIVVAPIANVTNMLAGQLPGLVTKQTSGIPGADDTSLNIRGFGSPLIIVDGVETSLNNLDPQQIETISMLKDGSASIYGARAGNGVLLITTKRGKQSKPTIAVNSSLTLQGSTNVIKPASSADRAQYQVDLWLNEGKDADQIPFTAEEIQKYRDGTDAKYLNTDWYSASIRTFAPQQNHNVTLSGGTESVKYFGYFGYNTQETILKKNGGNYDRYNFQVNVDAKVSDQLTVSMDMQHIKEKRFYPAGADGVVSNNNFWRDLIYAADPAYPLTLPDATKYSYAAIPYGNPVWAANSALSGYQDMQNNITQYRGEVKYDFTFVPGLNAKGVIIYRNNDYDQKNVKNQESFYTYNAETDIYTLVRNSQDPLNLSMSSSNNRKFVQQYSLNYQNTFQNAHTVSGMFLYEYQEENSKNFNTSRSGFQSMIIEELYAGDSSTAANSSGSSNLGRISWIWRLNYSYSDRFMLETILRADASSRFAKGYRWGYFPSVSFGWNIAKEEFVKKFDTVDLLKLRMSYGASGYDAVADFAYLTGFTYDATYTFRGELYSGLVPTSLANYYLTWEKMSVYDVGIDYSLWRRKLYGEVDYFYRERTGIPGSRVLSLPSSFGAALPLENLNSLSTSGFELRVGTVGRAGKVYYDISGNISYSRSKWIDYDEATYTDPDEIRLHKNSGKYTDRRVGYVSDGLFTSQEEIDAWNYTFDALNNDNSSLRPGDVKYKDLNNDDVINWRDQKEIGQGSSPHWNYGINMGFRYKNFDLSTLFQGAFGYTTYINIGGASIDTYYKNYWHETRNNNANALAARPGGSSTNGFYSDYYNHNTSYIRLKNISLGYEIPMSIITKANISKLRIYVAGTNIFTFSSIDKYGVDPEMPEAYGAGVYYPQQITMSIGCNLTF